MEETAIKKIFLSVGLIFLGLGIFLTSISANTSSNHKILASHENWTLTREEQGLLLTAKGRLVRVSSLNGVENALLAKSLQNVSFCALYRKDKKPAYFIRFSRSFVEDYYLEGKTSAAWREISQASFRKNSVSLLKYFEKLQNQLTVWQIEPIYSKKQLPVSLRESMKNDNRFLEELEEKYFWETIFTDWSLNKTSIFLSDIHIASSGDEKPRPLKQDLLYWIRDGLTINEKQSVLDGYQFNNLYLTTTMTTLEQQPAFSIDFGFRHLPAVLKMLKKYQSAI